MVGGGRIPLPVQSRTRFQRSGCRLDDDSDGMPTTRGRWCARPVLPIPIGSFWKQVLGEPTRFIADCGLDMLVRATLRGRYEIDGRLCCWSALPSRVGWQPFCPRIAHRLVRWDWSV